VITLLSALLGCPLQAIGEGVVLRLAKSLPAPIFIRTLIRKKEQKGKKEGQRTISIPDGVGRSLPKD
jgi:hypothetical protein